MSSSSISKLSAWIRLLACSVAVWLIFIEFIPWIYTVVPVLRHSSEQQARYDISAGAIYYTDVPISLESEMASREAVQRALESRKSSL